MVLLETKSKAPIEGAKVVVTYPVYMSVIPVEQSEAVSNKQGEATVSAAINFKDQVWINIYTKTENHGVLIAKVDLEGENLKESKRILVELSIHDPFFDPIIEIKDK